MLCQPLPGPPDANDIPGCLLDEVIKHPAPDYTYVHAEAIDWYGPTGGSAYLAHSRQLGRACIAWKDRQLEEKGFPPREMLLGWTTAADTDAALSEVQDYLDSFA